MNSRKQKEIICYCNNVELKVVKEAILNGAKTLNEIYDSTSAGIGPCGGSCRRKMGPLLEHYLKTGEFPEIIIEDLRGKKFKK